MPLNPLVFNPMINETIGGGGGGQYDMGRPAQRSVPKMPAGVGGGAGAASFANNLLKGFNQGQKMSMEREKMDHAKQMQQAANARAMAAEARAQELHGEKMFEYGQLRKQAAREDQYFSGKSSATAPEKVTPTINDESIPAGGAKKQAAAEGKPFVEDDEEATEEPGEREVSSTERKVYSHTEKLAKFDAQLATAMKMLGGSKSPRAQNELKRLQALRDDYLKSDEYEIGQRELQADRYGLKGSARKRYVLTGDITDKGLEAMREDNNYAYAFSKQIESTRPQLKTIEDILDRADKSGLVFKKGVGVNAYAKALGFNTAGELDANMKFLEANAAFMALQNLDKRGIKLTPITEGEIELAKNSVFKARQENDWPAFQKALREYHELVTSVNKDARYQYELARFRQGERKDRPKVPGLAQALEETEDDWNER